MLPRVSVDVDVDVDVDVMLRSRRAGKAASAWQYRGCVTASPVQLPMFCSALSVFRIGAAGEPQKH